MHHRLQQGPFYTKEAHQEPGQTEQKNLAHDTLWDSTHRSSAQQSRITLFMIGNSWQSCAACATGTTYSKAPPTLYLCTQITPTFATIATHGKSDRALPDIYQNANSTTSCWNINQAQQTELTGSRVEKTMTPEATQTTRM